MPIFLPVPNGLDYCSFKEALNSGRVSSLILFFFLKVALFVLESESESCSVVSDSLTHGLWPSRLLCSWNSPGKNTGVGSHSFLQEIFLTQRSNLGLLHYRQILYHLSHRRSSGKPLGPMNVQIHFKIRFFKSKKKVTTGILVGISLNLY